MQQSCVNFHFCWRVMRLLTLPICCTHAQAKEVFDMLLTKECLGYTFKTVGLMLLLITEWGLTTIWMIKTSSKGRIYSSTVTVKLAKGIHTNDMKIPFKMHVGKGSRIFHMEIGQLNLHVTIILHSGQSRIFQEIFNAQNAKQLSGTSIWLINSALFRYWFYRVWNHKYFLSSFSANGIPLSATLIFSVQA